MSYRSSHPVNPVAVRNLFVDRRHVLQIERDGKHSHLWRVRWPDGTLSTAVNISRAKDAALDFAEGLEARKTPHKSPLRSLGNFWWSRPPVAKNARRVPETISDSFIERKSISAASPTRRSEEAAALPGDSLDQWSDQRTEEDPNDADANGSNRAHATRQERHPSAQAAQSP